jgi:hypothetical protein
LRICCDAQVADVRAERDTLASQNATLAATTNQLMAPGSTPAADTAAATPSAASASSEGGGSFGRSRSVSAWAAADSAAAAPRISSAQPKEIGNMLARLTPENAALIKQRDKLQASLTPVTEEAQRAAAAAEAAQRERDALLQGRAAARADADAAKAEVQRCSAAVRQMTAERERLQQLVSLPWFGNCSCVFVWWTLELAVVLGPPVTEDCGRQHSCCCHEYLLKWHVSWCRWPPSQLSETAWQART